MAHINVDKRILNNIKNDDLAAMLNHLIDTELEKDVSCIDTDFVDACVDALIGLEQEENNKFVALVPLISSEKFLAKITSAKTGWKSLNVFVRAAVVAAVIASTTFTANAAVAAVTGVNVIENIGDAVQSKLEDLGLIKTNGIDVINGEDDDDTTFPEVTAALAETTTTTTTETTETTTAPTTKSSQITTKRGIDVIQGEDDDDETTTTTEVNTTTTTTEPTTQKDDKEPTSKPKESTTRKPVPPTTAVPVTEPDDEEEVYLLGIDAHFDNFKTDYIYGEELTYEGLTLYKVFSDGSKEQLSLDDCDYTKAIDMNKTADYVLRIIYDTCVVTIDITVRPDDDTRGSKICSNDLYDYLLTDSGAYITAYKGDETIIALDYVDGYEVIAIGPNVFKDSNVESVYAQNAEKIFPSAFENCKNLVDCYLPKAVYIGDNAFSGCENLAAAVYNDNLTYFGEGAYKNTAITELNVPSAITQIPKSLCEECPKLRVVNFDGDVTKIGANAFSECTSLEQVNGTENIIEVGEYAFYFNENMNFDKFPENIEIIKENAFCRCKKLEIGELNPQIKEIGDMSFAYCSKLTKVTIPDGMTSVPYGAFRATGITELLLPEGLTRINDYAFFGIMISDLNLPRSLETIGTYALYSTKLREVYFGAKITEIDDNAFFAGRKTTFHVYDKTVPLDYAIENDINYVIIEQNDSKGDRIDIIQGDDD